MKNVLALAAVLFLTESLTQASILQSWVTTPTSVTTSTVNYDVQIWLLVVPDPALGETLTSISQQGISGAAVSIVTWDSHLVTEPLPQSAGQTSVVKSIFNYNDFEGLADFKAQRADGTLPNFDTPDGDLDALEAAGTTSIDNLGIGVGAPVLLCTETWTMEQWAHADLHIIIQPSATHWDMSDPLGDGSNMNYFSAYQTGVNNDGVDLYVGPAGGGGGPPDNPEPATVVLFGFGAVATLMRRRKSAGK